MKFDQQRAAQVLPITAEANVLRKFLNEVFSTHFPQTFVSETILLGVAMRKASILDMTRLWNT